MEILVNIGCTNFIIYFLLTYELHIWLGFFSYKNVAAGLMLSVFLHLEVLLN
jgi:hypothetical protein